MLRTVQSKDPAIEQRVITQGNTHTKIQKDVKILVCGNCHYDPYPFMFNKDMVAKSHQHKINVIVAAENFGWNATPETFKTFVQDNEKELKFLDKLVALQKWFQSKNWKVKPFEDFLSFASKACNDNKAHYNGLCRLVIGHLQVINKLQLIDKLSGMEQLDIIEKLDIMNQLNTDFSALESEIKKYLIMKDAVEAQIELLKFLFETDTQYYGIDIVREAMIPILNKIGKVESQEAKYEVLNRAEPMRIETMKQAVLELARRLALGEGGVLLVNVGAAHAHRLAANVFLECHKNGEDHISVIPVCFLDTPYKFNENQKRAVSDFKSIIEESVKQDSEAVKQYYKSFPCQMLEILEVNKKVICQELSEMFSESPNQPSKTSLCFLYNTPRILEQKGAQVSSPQVSSSAKNTPTQKKKEYGGLRKGFLG